VAHSGAAVDVDAGENLIDHVKNFNAGCAAIVRTSLTPVSAARISYSVRR